MIFTPGRASHALDCISLVTRYSTVIRVIWLRHRQPIHIQYSDKINSQSLPDDTSGLSLLLQRLNLSSEIFNKTKSLPDKRTLGRVNNVKLGLIVIENFTNEDSGAYTCLVSRIGQKGQRLDQEMKTVYITTGVTLNQCHLKLKLFYVIFNISFVSYIFSFLLIYRFTYRPSKCCI